MAENTTTTLEVQGPRQISTQALLGLDGAEPLPLSSGVPYLVVRLGAAHAIALWLEAQQRMVITVHEDDPATPAAAAVFAELVARVPHFEIRHDPVDQIRYEFAWAS